MCRTSRLRPADLGFLEAVLLVLILLSAPLSSPILAQEAEAGSDGAARPVPGVEGAKPGSGPEVEPLDLSAVGIGSLFTVLDGKNVTLPTTKLEISLVITGVMLRGEIIEEFHNPTGQVIHARYIQPLPEKAAVHELEMRVGDRRIIGVVKEKGEAKQIYEKAKAEGKKAALVDQKRPNLFSTNVANINPGETIQVKLAFLEEVWPRDGQFECAFPLTFTPRYAPAGQTEETREANGAFVREGSAQAPRARITIEVHSGLALEMLESPSHRLVTRSSNRVTTATLEAGEVPADRDLVVRWRFHQRREPQGSFFIEERPEGRYGLLMLLPQAPESRDAGWLTDTIFLIDTSGSMDGPSIVQARAALQAALARLRPGDRFGMIRFNDNFEAFRPELQPVDSANLVAAGEWVQSLKGDGGTEMLPALLAGIDQVNRQGTDRPRRIVLITDGAVGNEEQAFQQVATHLGPARLHVIGIGNSPNRFLMRKLAQFGRGTSEAIGDLGEVQSRMEAFFERIDRPVLTDLALTWDGAAPAEVFPARIPDLYAHEPLVLSMRLTEMNAGARVTLKGRTGSGPFTQTFELKPDAPQGSGVAVRWARNKVEGLYDRLSEGAEEQAVVKEILGVALPFNLVTRYTSLVAVEERPTAVGEGRGFSVPNSLPLGSRLAGEDGQLPAGGTLDPMFLLLGIGFTGSAALFGIFGWRAKR